MTLRACADCGKTFLAKNTKRIYCDDCIIRHHREDVKERQNKNRTMHDFVCPICGKPFQNLRKNARYCSIECSLEARRRQKGNISKPKIEEAPKPKKNNLAEVIAEADRMGMSYGQYVARYGK